MERKSKRRLVQGPLPGGYRRGASGATAGGDSMQGGDCALNRRTPVSGNTVRATADTEPNSSNLPTPRTAAIRDASPDIDQGTTRADQPAQDTLPADQPAVTRAGKTRQRMTWTDEMNRHVMWCYYKASELETTSLYRSEMKRLFLQKFPNYTNVSEQRLVDQKRVIVNNNRLTQIERENIKRQVAENLAPERQRQIHTLENVEIHETEAVQDRKMQETRDRAGELMNRPEKDERKEALREALETNLAKWNGSDPTKRESLPKLQIDRETRKNITVINEILLDYVDNTESLEQLHTLIYCAALTIVLQNKKKIHKETVDHTNRKPKWQIRIEKRIDTLRRNIGKMTQYVGGNRARKVCQGIEQIMSGRRETIIETLDTLKQKLAVYSTRLRRYKESFERKVQNHTFYTNEKKFYLGLNTEKDIKIIPPTKEEIETFWQSIWSVPVQHNDNTPWIRQEKQRCSDIPQQTDITITCDELQKIIGKTHNWKAPGSDNIHNFWYKKLTSTHNILTQHINLIIQNPIRCPKFLMEGRTYIKPKTEATEDPANYRPITCLQTIYKIITSAITKKIAAHLSEYNILTEEQKGCKKRSQGCKEQLVIDSVIMKQVEKEQRNIHIAYIDYKKAFDSVPHSWLIAVLDIYKVNPTLRNFLAYAMTKWNTTIHLSADTRQIQTSKIKINRGIFQGDSLSALWFCMCLNPLSNTLNNTKYGFNIKHQSNTLHKINHLLYMDDIKIYAPTPTQLRSLLHITEEFSEDIGMEFGINKCRTLHVEKGKWANQENSPLTLNNKLLEDIQRAETYKYLGFQQNIKIKHTDVKKQLREAYKKRLSAILKTRLNSRNLFKAINTYAIPLLSYSFGVIKWSQTELEELNRLNRTELTKYRKLHPKSCIERVNISRNEGGRGLIDIAALHEKQIKGLRQYFLNKDTPIHKAIVKIDRNYTPLNLSQNYDTEDRYTITQKKENWAKKALHGKHPNIMQGPNIRKDLSYAWLQRGELFPETEGFLLAIQDQVILTRNYLKYIIKDPNIENDECRKCHQFQETIDHITGGCRMLAGTDYTERHNNAAKIVHFQIAKTYNLTKEDTPYYRYTPESVLENNEIKLYWDRTILTDKTIACNRPDITLIEKNTKHTYLIDIAIPNDSNVILKEEEKREKYQPLAMEVKELWGQEMVSVIPLVMSATGITSQTFTESLQKIQVPLEIHARIQKAVILNTCAIVRKFLSQ